MRGFQRWDLPASDVQWRRMAHVDDPELTRRGDFNEERGNELLVIVQEATFGLAHHVRDEISQVGSRVDPTAKGSQDGTRRPDGREAVTFLVRIKECVEDPSRILFEM